MPRKLFWLFTLVPGVLVADLWTKAWALRELMGQPPRELLGGLVPLTFALNRGAAFGLTIGSNPRWIFVGIAVVALFFAGALFLRTHPGDHLRLVALALITAGALGNLWDRLRWSRGVVDFIGPVSLGFRDFPIFNIADVAITGGGVLLAVSFWREEGESGPMPADPPPADSRFDA